MQQPASLPSVRSCPAGRFAPVLSWCRAHPILAPLCVGALLRLLAATWAQGWFAPDDLTYVIEQTRIWLTDPAASLPSSIRSELLPRAFWLIIEGARALGCDDPAVLLHVAYAVLGAWSLLAIPAVFRLTERRLGGAAAQSAAWLMSAFALVPHISIRALIGVVAIVPMTWGLALFDEGRDCSRWRPAVVLGTASGALLGLAAILRFQLGIVCLAAGAVGAWDVARRGSRRLPLALGLIQGGLLAAAAQAALDGAVGRQPFSTVLHYVAFNLAHAQRYGTSPWYAYLLQLAVFTVPPATLVLAGPMLRAFRRHLTVGVSLVAFLVAHSLIGHKEDRFIFPILPLLFVGLGAALAEARVTSGRLWAHRLFWTVNCLALVVATFADAQRNRTTPALFIARHSPDATVAVVAIASPLDFYLGERAHLVHLRDQMALRTAVERGLRPRYVISRDAPTDEQLFALQNLGLPCSYEMYAGDVVDRVLYALNPRRNLRRRPSALWRCTPG